MSRIFAEGRKTVSSCIIDCALLEQDRSVPIRWLTDPEQRRSKPLIYALVTMYSIVDGAEG
jgi:hypothetical protein